jgi:BMFP domain-containing protein YqiC
VRKHRLQVPDKIRDRASQQNRRIVLVLLNIRCYATIAPHIEGTTMTQTNNRLLDEFAKLMTDAAGAAQGVRREVGTIMKSQGERVLRDMDVVRRDEFDAVKAMAAKAREENDLLSARITALETALKLITPIR